MPKSEKDETLTALTSLVFSALLDELLLDVTLQSHHEVAKTKVPCKMCNMQCNLGIKIYLHLELLTNSYHRVHTPGSLSTVTQASSSSAQGASRENTPNSIGETKGGPNGSTGTGTSTPTSVKIDGNLFLECVSCSRQIASNRYAPHLGSCMGLANSRRGVARSNANKAKPTSEAGRSASPTSDLGYVSDERLSTKGKGNAKGKRAADEGDFTLKRKRPSSPQVSPNKKTKAKPSGSPVSRVKADPDISGMPTNSHFSPTTTSQSKVPSKLRDSSTASFLERSSSSSRSSSPEGVSVPTPASSSFTQSPSLTTRTSSNGRSARGRPSGTGPPKRPSPPRPPAIHPPHFDMDVDEGDETGSSTDTSDSS